MGRYGLPVSICDMVMVEKQARINRGFDRIAPIYDGLARLVFGQCLKEAQIALFSEIEPDSKVLILGGGTGWILTEVFRLSQPSWVCYVEASHGMMARTQEEIRYRGLPQHRIGLHLGTVETLRRSEKFEVVITPFFLDLFSAMTATQVIQDIKDLHQPHGIWLFTDFLPQNLTQRTLLKIMYSFFRLTCRIEGKHLLPFDQLFEAGGYYQDPGLQWRKGMLYSTIYRQEGKL